MTLFDAFLTGAPAVLGILLCSVIASALFVYYPVLTFVALFILLSVLVGRTALSDDSPALGANVGSQSSAFTIGNYNLFDKGVTYYGVYRYGGGGGRLQIGQGIGVSLSSTGGIIVHETPHTTAGLEVMNGTLVANSNRGVESQYTYLPAISVMGSLGPVMIGPKLGLYVGNLGGQGLTPHVDFQGGLQAYVNVANKVKAEVVYTRTLGEERLLSTELLVSRVVARYENYTGLRNEVNYLLLIKIGDL